MVTDQSCWPRAIIHIDMNCFFAAIEQLDNPELRNKPIAVTNGEQGTCIITSSYEARAYGIKTGMRLREAKVLCPHLIKVASRPKRYSEISRKIMSALTTITPDIEIFSVDEAFLDVSRCQQLGTPKQLALLARKKVFEVSGLPCSVGVSGDKTTAKFAAHLKKPNGFTMITPWEARARLYDVPVNELCGIGPGITQFLATYNVYTCGDMARLPIGILAKRFGNLGRRLWYMCQGADPDPVRTTYQVLKSMGHGKVLPPYTTDAKIIWTYLRHMTEKLAARLRRHQLQAQTFFIGLKSYDHGWLGDKTKLIEPTNDGRALFNHAKQILHLHWSGIAVKQIQVTALDPQPMDLQFDLLSTLEKINHKIQQQKINTVIDCINQRFGEFTVAPAILLNRTTMHDVIAPAWRPGGHRQTI